LAGANLRWPVELLVAAAQRPAGGVRRSSSRETSVHLKVLNHDHTLLSGASWLNVIVVSPSPRSPCRPAVGDDTIMPLVVAPVVERLWF
jgi:hypothetical protein